MSETQVLLARIATLRQELERAQEVRKDLDSGDASFKEDAACEDSVRRLQRQVTEGSTQTVLLDRALRRLTPASAPQDASTFPKQLTARAHRILEQGRELLGQLRSLAEQLESTSDFACPTWPERQPDRIDPLVRRYRETVAMANLALRVIQAFPDAPTAQLSLCEGVETILDVVVERTAEVTGVLEQRRRQGDRVETLARLLTALYAKESVPIQSFIPLAESLLGDAQHAAPLQFLQARPEQPAQFVACHSLTVAQVIARLARHDPDFRNNPLEPILTALLHDAGMLGVPPLILAQAGPLDDAQRRIVEAHTRQGAELMTQLLPSGSWLAEAALAHHERLDGSGYPAGRREAQLEPLPRLLAVCDVYAAFCTARPYRPAQDTRTALTDTLLLAEQGALDRFYAERLLQLSFYPVGSVVELADGALALVVATHMGRRDLSAPARPVVALLTDAQGRRLPVPRYVDLAECETRSIVRTVPKAERSTLLGSRYLE